MGVCTDAPRNITLRSSADGLRPRLNYNVRSAPVNATLFAILCNAVLCVAVLTLIRVLSRWKLASLAYYGGVFVGAVALFGAMWLIVALAEPHIPLTGEGHAGMGFSVPFILIGAAITLGAPVFAYGLRTSNTTFKRRRAEARGLTQR